MNQEEEVLELKCKLLNIQDSIKFLTETPGDQISQTLPFNYAAKKLSAREVLPVLARLSQPSDVLITRHSRTVMKTSDASLCLTVCLQVPARLLIRFISWREQSELWAAAPYNNSTNCSSAYILPYLHCSSNNQQSHLPRIDLNQADNFPNWDGI